MNMKLWNKALALTLSFAMVIGMLSTPVTAYAVSDEAAIEVSAQAETSVDNTEDANDAASFDDSFDPEDDPSDQAKEPEAIAGDEAAAGEGGEAAAENEDAAAQEDTEQPVDEAAAVPSEETIVDDAATEVTDAAETEATEEVAEEKLVGDGETFTPNVTIRYSYLSERDKGTYVTLDVSNADEDNYRCDVVLVDKDGNEEVLDEWNYIGGGGSSYAGFYASTDCDPGEYLVKLKVYDNYDRVGYSSGVTYIVGEAPVFDGENPEIQVTPSSGTNGAIRVKMREGTGSAYIKGSNVEKTMLEYDNYGKYYFINGLEPGIYYVCYGDFTGGFYTSYFAGTGWTKVTVNQVAPELESIVIAEDGQNTSLTEKILYKNGSVKLNAIFYPANYEDTEVVWKSDNEAIATVDQKGLVKAVSAGTAVITAAYKANADFSPSVTITVLDKTDKEAYKPRMFAFSEDPVNIDLTSDPASKKATVTLTGDSKLTENAVKIYFSSEGNDVATITATSGSVLGENNTLTFDIDAKQPGQMILYAEPRSNENLVVAPVSAKLIINVNGIGSQGVFKDGKRVTGWVNTDENIVIVSTGKIDQNAAYTFYFTTNDPRPVNEPYQVGKKLYLFGTSRSILMRGKVTEDKSLYDDPGDAVYCLNKDGSLNTGWQSITKDGKKVNCYFYPETGEMAKNMWVPKGKGSAYVDASGVAVEGTELIQGGLYYVNKGILGTGFVYVDGKNNIVAKKAAEKMYYFDPTTGGKRASGFFTVKNKQYYADSTTGFVMQDAKFDVRDSHGTYTYYADKDGVIVKDKLINIGDNYYYAGSDGAFLKNTAVVVKGTPYNLGPDGAVMSISDFDDELLGYYEDEEGKPTKKAYVRNLVPEDPTKGLVYYDETKTTVLKNTWIYDPYSKVKCLYLDKKGKPTIGVAKIGTSLYYFEEDGYYDGSARIIYPGEKGVYYYVNDEGAIETNVGFKKIVSSPEGSRNPQNQFIYVKNNKGVLADGVTTIDKHRYIFKEGKLLYIYFPTEEEEKNADALEHMIATVINGEVVYYYLDTVEYPKDEEGARKCYIATFKTPVLIEGKSGKKIGIGKDGSVYSGAINKSGKTYFSIMGEVIQGSEYRMMVRYKGKLYCTGPEGCAVSGWCKVVGLLDIDKFNMTRFDESLYCYTDPKKLTVVTGWKEVPVPALDSNGAILQDENGNIALTGKTAKLYFGDTSSSLQTGALARNINLTIKNKVYKFGPDGTLTTGEDKAVAIDDKTIITEAFVKKDGTLATGRIQIGKDYYYYSPRTYKMERNVVRKTGSKWYFYGANGKMAQNLTATTIDGRNVYATFKADGSISGFRTAYEVIKNTVISITQDASGDKYDRIAIGNKGMPVTGIFEYASHKMYFESDGYGAISNAAIPDYYLQKVGGKIYLMRGGMVVTPDTIGSGGSAEVSLKNMYGVPKSQINEYERYAGLLKLFRHMSGETVQLIPKTDGTIGKCVMNYRGFTFHVNKYGIPLDVYSPFAKDGGNWYISPIVAMSASANHVDVEMDDMNEDSAYARIAWDNNYKITSITYLSEANGYDTGKPVDGFYSIDMPQFDESVVMLKNGKFVTGKKKISSFGISVEVYFDPELGVANIEESIFGT